MAARKPHHPPIPGIIRAPTTDDPGYIYGTLGLAGFGRRAFYVATIPRAQAVQTILARHYSRRIVANSYVHLGIYQEGQCIGVMQFGYALNPRGIGRIVAGTQVDEYLELNRMWLDDIAPRNSESQAIAYAVRFIRRACPKVRWIQSFADERCGRWGVVYQAANFLYLGSHMTEFWELDGETYHRMLLTAHGKCGVRGVHLKANLHRATCRRLRQFRYIYFIQRKYLRDLRLRPQPYPKPTPQQADADGMNGVPSVHPETVPPS